MYFIYHSILLSTIFWCFSSGAMVENKQNNYHWSKDLYSVKQLERVRTVFEEGLPSEFLPQMIDVIWPDGQTILDHVIRERGDPEFIAFVISRGASRLTRAVDFGRHDELLENIGEKELFSRRSMQITFAQQERIVHLIKQLVPARPVGTRDLTKYKKERKKNVQIPSVDTSK